MSQVVMAEPQPFLFLAHHARTRPGSIALSSIARDVTYEETHAYAVSIAGLLRRRGVRPGDVVGVQIRADFNLYVMEAVFHEAAIWCSLGGDVERATLVGADWLIVHEPSATFDAERTIIVDDDFMIDVARATYQDPPLLYDSFESVCRLSFSSGTTGRPVAVPSTVIRQGRPSVGWLESRPFFSLIQGFSGSGVKTACESVLLGDTYICPGDPEDNVTLAQRNLVATLQGSPAQLAQFLDVLSQRENRRHEITTVQFIGSFLSASLLGRIHHELGATVTACYGSSEVGMVALRHDVRDTPADVGIPLEHVTVQIVDDHDCEMERGEVGRIRVRTTRRDPSYFRAGDAERDALRDGWFYPGDLGAIDERGHLVLSSRESDVINAGGVKFNAVIIDEFLGECDGVVDGVIVSSLDDSGLPSYAAVVVARDDLDVTSLIEPLTAATGGVAPSCIYRVIAIQRDANGKVPRAALARRIDELSGSHASRP